MTGNAVLLLSLAALTLAFLVGGVLTLLERRSVRALTRSGVLLGQPSMYPTAVVAALKQLFARYPAVKAAYLAEIYDASTGAPPHSIIGLEVDEDFPTVQHAAGVLVREHLKEGEPIDFLPIGDDPVSQYLTMQTTPFYVRPPGDQVTFKSDAALRQ